MPYVPEWMRTPCPRCDLHHPRHCPECYRPGDPPPCWGHVCSWPNDEEDDST
jgi:hypothetical protein